MTYVADVIRGVGGIVADSTTVGTGTWVKVTFAGTLSRRTGVMLTCDPASATSYELYVLLRTRGGSTPTVSTSAAQVTISNGATETINATETIDIWVQASGASTPYAGIEVYS